MELRHIKCCKCASTLKLPIVWMIGVETVFKCKKCSTIYKTGYKMGAVLFAISLTLALVTANLLAFIFSSVTLPVIGVLIIPLWLFYGLILRRAWLVYRCRRGLKAKEMSDESKNK